MKRKEGFLSRALTYGLTAFIKPPSLSGNEFPKKGMVEVQLKRRNIGRETGTINPPVPKRVKPPFVPKTVEPPSPLKVFLCHGSEDKRKVRNLYHRLLAEEIEPWLDEESILPGEDWERAISEAVADCDVILVCLSSKSVNKSGVIQKEISMALDKAREQTEGSIFIIPLKLEECEIPRRLRRWQWVNMFKANGFDRLMSALESRAESSE